MRQSLQLRSAVPPHPSRSPTLLDSNWSRMSGIRLNAAKVRIVVLANSDLADTVGLAHFLSIPVDGRVDRTATARGVPV